MKNIEIFRFNEIDSTNNFLLSQNYNNKSQLCIAEKQTNGKGQYGRLWQQQRQSALFSLKIELLASINLNGLSLVAGLAVIYVLEKNYNIQNLSLKWPNDIFLNGKKLGGILIENILYGNVQYPVIGIGLNIKSNNFTSIDQNINTEQLILRIVDSLLFNILQFEKLGFKSFKDKWRKYDFLSKNKIKINYKKYKGISAGVNDNGCLIFKNNSIEVIIYSSSQINIIL